MYIFVKHIDKHTRTREPVNESKLNDKILNTK